MIALARAMGLTLALLLAACGNANNGRMQGWIEGDFVFVGPDEMGRVETLSVREGDQVAARAPLFTVDSDLQQSDVNTTSAQVAEARERLRRLEAQQQRTEEVAVLEAQEKRAEAMLQLSTAEFDRQQQLFAKGAGTQAALDTAKSNFNRDTAALDQVRRQITVARLSAREEDIAAARQTLAAAESRKTAAETRLARRKLVSPVTGAVQQIYYRPGEMVPAGRPVLSILPPGNIKIRFFIGEPLLATIALGDMVEVTCDGCATPIAAKVSFIARSAEYTPPVIYSLEERNKLVFMVEARTDTPEGLRVGQPVSVALTGRTTEARK
ncbi:MAG: HlyD family efflux transporter periplasmic adaptor subunit [Alphaproteobacteria bacterium]